MLKKKDKKIPQTISQLKQAGKTINALIYCRVSSEKQRKEGHGLDSQEARCREYAKSNGYAVEDRMIFKDSASGGGEYTSRPGQVEIIEFIDKHPHMDFVVIVDDISRVARDVQGHFHLRYALRERGVEIVSPNFNFENSLEGEVLEGVMAVMSQYHRKGNARQVTQKMKARVEAGYWSFGRKRGYSMIKDPLHGKIAVPNSQGLKILKPALEAFANGNLANKMDFCRYLVDRDFWKNKTPEKYLSQATVLLKDPFYAGVIVFEKWDVESRQGHHKPLISLATHEKILDRLAKPRASSHIRKDMREDFPLRGLLKCSSCGKHMTGAYSKGRHAEYPYYLCLNRGCPLRAKSLARDIVEKEFKKLMKGTRLKGEISRVVEIVFDRVWKEELSSFEKQESVIIRNAKEQREIIRDLTTLARKAKTNEAREGYEYQIGEAVQELKESHKKPLSEMDTTVPYRTALRKSHGLIKSPYTVWEEMTLEERHLLFFFIFDEKLAYDKKEGYRTAEILTAAKLFEEFVVSNSDNVDISYKSLNRLKIYLARFWDFYLSSPKLQKALENA